MMAIKRVWPGWTIKDNALKYQAIMSEKVLPGIEAKNIPGYQKIEVLKLEREEEVEFVTIMTFESLQNVKDFQGEDYKRCYVPDIARQVLERWDQEALHYELIEARRY